MAKKPASYLAGSMLLGTAIGAVVGLLTAPVAGRELRGKLRRKVADVGTASAARFKEVPPWRDLPDVRQRLVAALPEQGRRLAARVVPGWQPPEASPPSDVNGGTAEVAPSPEQPGGGAGP
ncbi:MAG: YtxH domain-containing protein [Candidatus Sericytochromatia bacterium]|nr:YtxH domain-containing protein [Candidatus Sericytochromatia bacterium]